jgi:predicted phosphate transport protein (TIGR00153 family)
MRFRLIPRDETFFLLFGQGGSNARSCAELLRSRMADLTSPGDLGDRVVEAERAGDRLTREIRDRLDKVIVTPFDREDIHVLAEQLDDAVDNMRAASDLIGLHHVSEAIPGITELIEVLVQASQATERLLGKLAKLRDLHVDLDEIDRLESEGDDIYRRTTARLFSGEHDTFTVLKWMGIVDALEAAIDAFQDTGKIVSSIALKHA